MLRECLARHGWAFEVAPLYAGQALPSDPEAFSAILSMGGPMNAFEDAQYPFLKEETAFLQRALAREVPMLGVCLGAQMIARAAGARVVDSPAKEVGWSQVELTAQGMADPLWQGLEAQIPVFQWHQDMFEIPAGAQHLARSADCPNQAFRLGNAWALQFHVEATGAMLEGWFSDNPNKSSYVGYWERNRQALEGRARRVVENFAKLVGKSGA